jgi:hypothetical protein
MGAWAVLKRNIALLGALSLWGCGGGDSEKKPPEDVTLPDPGPNGWQWTTGTFEVPHGEEIQDCYFYEVPGTEPLYVNRVTLAQNQGTHHMNVFRVKTVQKLGGKHGDVVVGGECWNSGNWADWPLVTNSQSGGDVQDWNMPQGVALRFEPGEKIMIQTHYVNASTQKTPTKGKVVVNFYGVEQAAVEHEMGTVFATNQNIRICPGDKNKTFEATCKIAPDGPVTINAANGHFHSRGQKFTINTWDPVGGKGDQFYESLVWDEPPFAKDLSVPVQQNGGISWTCDFSALANECGDPNDDCCFTFGGFVEYQEHCNAFVYYWPKGATEKNCF